MESQKRNASLSNSFHQSTKAQNIIQVRQRHHSAIARVQVDEVYDTQENVVKNIIAQSIQKVNMINEQVKDYDSQWKMIMSDEKKTNKGIKTRLKWKNNTLDIWVTVCFTLTTNSEDNIVELEELNINLTLKELRQVQQSLTTILKQNFVIFSTKRHKFIDEMIEESIWFQQVLLKSQKLYKELKLDEKPKNQGIEIKKQKLNGNYTLYHAPVVLAWSCQGIYCLTENNIPKFKKPYICNKNSFRQHMEVQYRLERFIINENQIIIEPESKPESYYSWDLAQELDFVTFHSQASLKYEQKGGEESEQENRDNGKSKRNNTEVLAYLNRTPIEIRKIYVHHFDPNPGQRFHKHDKLKVYSVQNELMQTETAIFYIIHRINTEKQKKVSEIILENELSGYSSLLDGHIDEFKYILVKNFIKEGNKRIDCLSLGMKAILLQNEHFHIQLSNYFIKAFNFIDAMPSWKITSLGSYQHFNRVNSEHLLIELLKHYHKGSTRKQYLNVSYPQDKQSIMNPVVILKVNRRFCLSLLEIEWLMTDSERLNFLHSIVPMIWIRDRNCLKFQYKQIARILSTNSQILRFLKTMNDIVCKLKQGRVDFINTIIKNYQLYQQKIIEKEILARRSYTVKCHWCDKVNHTYELSEVLRLATCKKCQVNNS